MTNENETKQEKLIIIVTNIRNQYQPADLWFTL